MSPFTNRTELKELPFPLDGSFGWLRDRPVRDYHIGSDQRCRNVAERTRQLLESSDHEEVTLPKAFVVFLRSPELHERLRSCTDCYLNVATTPLPFVDGYLVRFLADSQGCVYWYLFVTDQGSSEVLIAYERFDAEQMDYELNERDFAVVGESFEAFVCRFWLENELWFASDGSESPPDVDPRFLSLYYTP